MGREIKTDIVVELDVRANVATPVLCGFIAKLLQSHGAEIIGVPVQTGEIKTMRLPKTLEGLKVKINWPGAPQAPTLPWEEK